MDPADALIASVERLDADMRRQWERSRASVTAPPAQGLRAPKSGKPDAAAVPAGRKLPCGLNS